MSDYRLVIDSSGATASAALFDGRLLVAADRSDRATHHAKSLLPLIDRVLRRAGEGLADPIRPRDLSSIYVCTGPGSFTGVRVAVSTAKGLAHPHGIPLYAFSSGLLTLCAYGPNRHGDAHVACCADAGRGEVYYTLFDRDYRFVESRLAAEQKFRERASSEGWRVVREPDYTADAANFFAIEHREAPDEADLAGILPTDARRIRSRYYRKPQAEEKRDG